MGQVCSTQKFTPPASFLGVKSAPFAGYVLKSAEAMVQWVWAEERAEVLPASIQTFFGFGKPSAVVNGWQVGPNVFRSALAGGFGHFESDGKV